MTTPTGSSPTGPIVPQPTAAPAVPPSPKPLVSGDKAHAVSSKVPLGTPASSAAAFTGNAAAAAFQGPPLPTPTAAPPVTKEQALRERDRDSDRKTQDAEHGQASPVGVDASVATLEEALRKAEDHPEIQRINALVKDGKLDKAIDQTFILARTILPAHTDVEMYERSAILIKLHDLLNGIAHLFLEQGSELDDAGVQQSYSLKVAFQEVEIRHSLLRPGNDPNEKLRYYIGVEKGQIYWTESNWVAKPEVLKDKKLISAWIAADNTMLKRKMVPAGGTPLDKLFLKVANQIREEPDRQRELYKKAVSRLNRIISVVPPPNLRD